MWRRLRNIHVLLHVRANGDSPVSFDDDTHAVVTATNSGHESMGYTQSGPQCWVASLAHGHVLKQGRGQK